MLAISMDDPETMARFKASLGARFPFIPDPQGELAKLYRVKAPLVGLALRYTFVVGPGRQVLEVSHGKDAVDVSSSIVACELPVRR